MKSLNLSEEERFELIRKKAHQIYLERGGIAGSPLGDWLEAERLVTRELAETEAPAPTDKVPKKASRKSGKKKRDVSLGNVVASIRKSSRGRRRGAS